MDSGNRRIKETGYKISERAQAYINSRMKSIFEKCNCLKKQQHIQAGSRSLSLLFSALNLKNLIAPEI